MKKIASALLLASMAATSAFSAKFALNLDLEHNTLKTWIPSKVMVASPLNYDVIFVGGEDMVQTPETYGNPAGMVPAKQWHDFIGFTLATPEDKVRVGEDVYGFVSVNHERIQDHDRIGDGGGMTVFAVKRTTDNKLEVMEQTIEGRGTAEFFNVDFVNTVGETGMNCGGINSIDGRIWTAEEWFQTSLDEDFRDDEDFIIGTTKPNGFEAYNGQKIERYQNLNYMVEIDPRKAKAIRKQYNWGRQPFESGAIDKDNKTVYLGGDNTPGLFTKFVADVPGDFTNGSTYVFSQKTEGSAKGTWVEIDMEDFDNVLDFQDTAFDEGAAGFNRIEWITIDQKTGKVYFTETGRDHPGDRLEDAIDDGGTIANHHYERAEMQGYDSPLDDDYWDYYGRVMVYDPETGSCDIYLEGGPFFNVNSGNHIAGGSSTKGSSNKILAPYPEKHLSNPDGLVIMEVEGKSFMVICEDLIGTSYGRVKPGIGNKTCELWILDMEDEAIVDNLTRVGVIPIGAEVTGVCPTPDGKNLLVNSQHPDTYNEYPFNNSLTFVLTGWEDLVSFVDEERDDYGGSGSTFNIFPNPTSREVNFEGTIDAALYDSKGQRLKVVTNSRSMDVREYTTGTYYIQNADGAVQKLIIE